MAGSLLVVDDHQPVRTLLSTWLSMVLPGWTIYEAADGQTAIQLALCRLPQVILMDIGLPDVSGIEAGRRIKAALPETHIIMLTIHEGEFYRADSTAAGASAYVPKRTMHTDLIPTLNTLLTRSWN